MISDNKLLNKLIYVFIGLFLLMIIFLCCGLPEYISIFIVLMIIDGICIYLYHKNNRTDKDIYKVKVRKILKTYDSILVRLEKLPDLSKKDIMKVNKFEELINIQGETKKPIFYAATTNTISFVLIDNNLVCYTVLKENKNLVDPVECDLMLYSVKNKRTDIDESILAELERTTIIKLPNVGTYKVSPIKKSSNINTLEQLFLEEEEEII